MRPGDFYAVIYTNLNSILNCTENAICGMIELHYGRIINILLVKGQRGYFGFAA
jgi:acetoacetyl-CoA reductase